MDTHEAEEGTPLIFNNSLLPERHKTGQDTSTATYQSIDNSIKFKRRGWSNKRQKKKAKELQKPPVTVLSTYSLFRYTSCKDKILVFIGILSAIVSGCVSVAESYVFAIMVDNFSEFQVGSETGGASSRAGCATNSTERNSTWLFSNNTSLHEDFVAQFGLCAVFLCGIAVLIAIFNALMVLCLMASAENQVFAIRSRVLQSILRQDASWFDTRQQEDFASHLTADMDTIREAIGEKLGIVMTSLSALLASILIGFFLGWKLTLTLLAITIIISLAMAMLSKVTANVSSDGGYHKAGAVAEEVLSSIRTVYAFGGESKEIERYDKKLVHACKSGIRAAFFISMATGIGWLFIFLQAALAFWYGSRLIIASCHSETQQYTAGSVLMILNVPMRIGAAFNVLIAQMEVMTLAREAAGALFEIIERVPPIDSSSADGEKPAQLRGRIEFAGVYFQYPSRKEIPILKGVSLEIKEGQTVAFVGPSGCGKSTLIDLIQRFYDPTFGQVLLDGKDIRRLNVGWLRQQIGVVKQEPALFATTIAENIRYGCPSASMEDIEKAAMQANAHRFIMALPENYATDVGVMGEQLSGGQKQRIAIARALVRNPKILLLDEATSALDTENEAIVQKALDKAGKGRTTVIVAHRLSTICNADKIFVISGGRLSESGSHIDLLERKGFYYELTRAQYRLNVKPIHENQFSLHRPLLRKRSSMRSSHVPARSVASRSLSLSGSGSWSGPSSSLCVTDDEHGSIEEEQEAKSVSQVTLLRMAKPEWKYIGAGTVASAVEGCSILSLGLLLGYVINAMSISNEAEMLSQMNMFALIYVGMGLITGTASFLQTMMFSVAGERLTARLRKTTFETMLSREIGWFDKPGNSVGVLIARLSGDASNVQEVLGSRLSVVVTALSLAVAASVVSVVLSWKFGLVSLAIYPMMMLACYIESLSMRGKILEEKTAVDESVKVAVEAISNIRTVASLYQERDVHSRYLQFLLEYQRNSRFKPLIRSFTYGIQPALPALIYGLILYYGSFLISKHAIKFSVILQIGEAILTSAEMIAKAVIYAPDYVRAQVATYRILKVLKDEVKTVNMPPSSHTLDTVSGQLNYKNVHFYYPTRPNAKVFHDFNLTVEPRKTVALVGVSGCGKSTCFQLLERFYDPLSGNVMLDEVPVTKLNLSWLRSQISIVSQEPALFNRSIKENIAYGNNACIVPMNEIIRVAEMSNIHNFITTLPAGYDTKVGHKGLQLSGGQKQRLAIARALIRNPKILLLDEATSALDSESEKIVQDALEKASVGRTCLVIAHRLSTIQNADMIAVLRAGRVVEKGTHNELIARKGAYYSLYTAQLGQP